jgi:hypothetical protein
MSEAAGNAAPSPGVAKRADPFRDHDLFVRPAFIWRASPPARSASSGTAGVCA